MCAVAFGGAKGRTVLFRGVFDEALRRPRGIFNETGGVIRHMMVEIAGFRRGGRKGWGRKWGRKWPRARRGAGICCVLFSAIPTCCAVVSDGRWVSLLPAAMKTAALFGASSTELRFCVVGGQKWGRKNAHFGPFFRPSQIPAVARLA
jgi:hypothetical protein